VAAREAQRLVGAAIDETLFLRDLGSYQVAQASRTRSRHLNEAEQLRKPQIATCVKAAHPVLAFLALQVCPMPTLWGWRMQKAVQAGAQSSQARVYTSPHVLREPIA
jgi:hypothetical protein